MAPNLLVKAAFVRGEFGNVETTSDSKVECVDRNSVRLDFVLQNIYSHLIKDSSNFTAISAANRNEEIVLHDLKEIADAFKQTYVTTIQKLCSEIEDIQIDTLGSILLGVSNELFCEGVTWSRIVAFIVFVGELTLQSLSKGYPVEIVDVMYDCFRKLVKDSLMGWINDHGGWDGLRTLSKTPGESSPHLPDKMESGNKGWAKSILHGTVRMIGTLAQIANSTSQTIP